MKGFRIIQGGGSRTGRIAMKCDRCQVWLISRKTTRQTAYRSLLMGLSKARFVGITVSQCPRCSEEAPTIPSLGPLLRVMSRAVSQKVTPFTGEEFTFLRKGLGISLQHLARVTKTPELTVRRTQSRAWRTKVLPRSVHYVRLEYFLRIFAHFIFSDDCKSYQSAMKDFFVTSGVDAHEDDWFFEWQAGKRQWIFYTAP